MFEKITKVSLPFDMRNSDPSKNYGIHGLDVWFILKGKKGAVQFMVNFGVYLPSVDKSKWTHKPKEINGYDVGYHSPTPFYENQRSHDCDILEGKKCYYDGSGLRASDWVDELFSITGERIDEHVWKKLEQEYQDRFETENENENN